MLARVVKQLFKLSLHEKLGLESAGVAVKFAPSAQPILGRDESAAAFKGEIALVARVDEGVYDLIVI